MTVLTLVKLSYFIAATLFLLGLQRMASPKTARSGIQWAGAGMVLATLATFFLPGLHNIVLMVVAIVIGVALNWLWGKKVAITDMPDRVVWLPLFSPGSHVHATLRAQEGDLVALAPAPVDATDAAGGAA